MKKIQKKIHMLTISRILWSLCFFVIGIGKTGNGGTLAIFYGMIVGSDFLDGYLARKYNVASSIGGMLDIGCDLFFMVGAYSLLLYHQLISWWIVCLIFGKFLEFILTSLYYRKKTVVMSPICYDFMGKAGAGVAYLLPWICLEAKVTNHSYLWDEIYVYFYGGILFCFTVSTVQRMIWAWAVR